MSLDYIELLDDYMTKLNSATRAEILEDARLAESAPEEPEGLIPYWKDARIKKVACNM